MSAQDIVYLPVEHCEGQRCVTGHLGQAKLQAIESIDQSIRVIAEQGQAERTFLESPRCARV
jgi:hypothetical protein